MLNPSSKVIYAFLVSAELTMIATAICLLFSRGREPSDDTYNAIDRGLRKLICEPVHRFCGKDRAELIADTAYDVVLSLSDTQLVTAIAMLIAAVVRLFDGTITVYHFSMVTELVWLAANSHLLSLLVVRSYHDSVKPVRTDNDSDRGKPQCSDKKSKRKRHKRPNSQLAMWMRTVLMAGVAGLLLFCSTVSGYEFWNDEYSCPALCTLDGESRKGGEPKMWMEVNYFFILYSYPLAIFMLIRPARQWWIDHVRKHFQHDEQKPGNDLLSRVLGAIVGTGRAQKWLRETLRWAWYLLASETSDFVESIAWFVLGVFWIWGDEQVRQGGHSIMDDGEREKEESIHGFGQLVPIVLLGIPLLQVFEAYAAHSIDLAERKMKDDFPSCVDVGKDEGLTG